MAIASLSNSSSPAIRKYSAEPPATTAPAAKKRFDFSLSLEINGTNYNVAPIDGIQDETIERAWRLEKHGNPDAIYDVARGTDGLVTCSCPDYIVRHQGLSLTGCKHCKAIVGAGLLEPANILKPTAEERADAKAAFAPVVVETPLLCSTLPAIDGSGLSTEEWFRVNGRSNQVKADYAAEMSDATDAEIHAVGQRAAKDALRAVLKARFVAPCCDEIEAVPCLGCLEAIEEPRLTLAEVVEVEEARLRDRGNDAGDLMADALKELARVIRVVDADRPDQLEERLSILDRDYTEVLPTKRPSVLRGPQPRLVAVWSDVDDADVMMLAGSVG